MFEQNVCMTIVSLEMSQPATIKSQMNHYTLYISRSYKTHIKWNTHIV
jgi:hypothetical protein